MKSHFPIFKNNPDLIYLDSAASTQKPQFVIDGIKDFLENDYANIHRWLYSLSEKSENLYHQSKTMLANLINCEAKEIIYSYNSTYCFNLLAQALVNTDNKWEKKIWPWDSILLGIQEHHSNILPRQMLAKTYGFEIRFLYLDQNYNIDRDDFSQKYDETVKVISLSHVSNTTGQIINLTEVKKHLREDTFFIVDGSQSVPHFPVNVQTIWCDALIITAHKMLADTGLWMLYLKHHHIKNLNPLILGGWTPKDVDQLSFSLEWNSDKREAGTPNIIWAISLLKALEFIQSIGWIQTIREHEKKLISYCIQQFKQRSDYITVFGSLNTPDERLWVFSFELKDKPFNKVGEFLASHNICVRAGWHCAYPLHKFLSANGSVRISTYLYNDEADLESFFNIIKKMYS